jgi:hypothetical protein
MSKSVDTVNSTALITNTLTKSRGDDPIMAAQKFKELHYQRFGNRRAHNDSRRLVETLTKSTDAHTIQQAVDAFINNRLTNDDFRKSLTTHMLFKAGLLSTDKVERNPENHLLFKRK